MQSAPINPNSLSLSVPLQKEVNGKAHFRQYLRVNGAKVILSTNNFETEKLVLNGTESNLSALIPTTGSLRTQLNILESYITQNVSIPNDMKQPADCKASQYKALWQQDNMYIQLSPWCDYFTFSAAHGNYMRTTKEGPFGKGIYHVTIEAPYIYIGPHKDGHLFSLTLRVVQVLYDPAPPTSGVNQLLDSLIVEKKKPKSSGRAVKKSVN